MPNWVGFDYAQDPGPTAAARGWKPTRRKVRELLTEEQMRYRLEPAMRLIWTIIDGAQYVATTRDMGGNPLRVVSLGAVFGRPFRVYYPVVWLPSKH